MNGAHTPTACSADSGAPALLRAADLAAFFGLNGRGATDPNTCRSMMSRSVRGLTVAGFEGTESRTWSW